VPGSILGVEGNVFLIVLGRFHRSCRLYA